MNEILANLKDSAIKYQNELTLQSGKILEIEKELKSINLNIPFKYEVEGLPGDGAAYISWEKDKKLCPSFSRLYLIIEGGIDGNFKKALIETNIKVRQHYIRFLDDFTAAFLAEITNKMEELNGKL